MSLADTELINAKVFEVLQRWHFVFPLQILFVQILDRIPAYRQNLGYPGDSHPVKQICSEPGKSPCISPFASDKRKPWPSQRSTLITTNPPDLQNQEYLAATDRNHSQHSHFRTFAANSFPAPTDRATFHSRGDFSMEYNSALFVLGGIILDSFQTISMIE